MSDEVVESFRPTSGHLMGYLALALAGGTAVLGVVDRQLPAAVIWISLLAVTLVWASMLRPRVWVTTADLVMRNMLHTVAIPLAAIEQMAVRQVLAVRAGEQRYVSPAIGRSWRQNLKAGRAQPGAKAAPAHPPDTVPYPEFVEERLHHLAEEARARAGIRLMSDEQLELAGGVRRSWAWPEIAALAVTTTGTLLSFII